MSKTPSPNAPCPCGRALKYKQCCGVFHRGRPALPHALMRARYSAYALGRVDFIMDTTHPASPHFRQDRSAWKADLLDYCRGHLFLGLVVEGHELAPDESRAWVTFVAQLRSGDQLFSLAERSLFVREGMRWKYVRDDPRAPHSTGSSGEESP